MCLSLQNAVLLKTTTILTFEVEGVPYSILKPLLELCTPDQLYRMEKYNHVLVKKQINYRKFIATKTLRKKSQKSMSRGG